MDAGKSRSLDTLGGVMPKCASIIKGLHQRRLLAVRPLQRGQVSSPVPRLLRGTNGLQGDDNVSRG